MGLERKVYLRRCRTGIDKPCKQVQKKIIENKRELVDHNQLRKIYIKTKQGRRNDGYTVELHITVVLGQKFHCQ